MGLAAALAGVWAWAHGPGTRAGPAGFAAEKLALVNAAYERGVKSIFLAKCWNCHGDATDYPWYYRIPGIRGLIDEDIAEAREHLNMAPGFPFAAHDDPAEQLARLESVAEYGWMPPRLYRWAHPGSKIREADKEAILKWVSESRKVLGIRYVCPTHPEAASERPGLCPQCRMRLQLKLAEG